VLYFALPLPLPAQYDTVGPWDTDACVADLSQGLCELGYRVHMYM
jgi:hypothetical protein